MASIWIYNWNSIFLAKILKFRRRMTISRHGFILIHNFMWFDAPLNSYKTSKITYLLGMWHRTFLLNDNHKPRLLHESSWYDLDFLELTRVTKTRWILALLARSCLQKCDQLFSGVKKETTFLLPPSSVGSACKKLGNMNWRYQWLLLSPMNKA